MNLSALSDPFPASDIEWRLQSAGEKDSKVWARVLAYVTNRAIQQRFDDVCGPAGWRNEFQFGPSGAVLCGLSVRVGDDWITKWDGAENTDIEAVKGGLSGAMKRAAVQWGVGRYLYDLEEGFALVGPHGKHYAPKKDGKYPSFKWDPPLLPAWALPGGSGRPGVVSTVQSARGQAARATLAAAEQKVGLTPSSGAPAVAAQAPVDRPADVRLPGAPKQLHGHGGKRIGEVETAALEVILQDLQTLGQSRYAPIIEAIGEVLADRAGEVSHAA